MISTFANNEADINQNSNYEMSEHKEIRMTNREMRFDDRMK